MRRPTDLRAFESGAAYGAYVHPKPFFGYSDNTNLHLFLWNLGLISYQGGAVMVQFGRPGSIHPVTRQSIEKALFTRGSYVLGQPADYNDEEGGWADPAVFSTEPPGLEAEPWSWHGPKTTVTGPRSPAVVA